MILSVAAMQTKMFFFSCPGLKNILPITTAKVPIVKFYHNLTGLEGDISLYNTLVGLRLLFLEFSLMLEIDLFFSPGSA